MEKISRILDLYGDDFVYGGDDGGRGMLDAGMLGSGCRGNLPGHVCEDDGGVSMGFRSMWWSHHWLDLCWLLDLRDMEALEGHGFLVILVRVRERPD